MESAALPPLAPRAALRWDVVRRLIAGLEPGTILELGCGQGAMGARLAGLARYTAAEPDDASYALARARIEARGGTVVHGDHHAVAGAGAGAGGYDVVCAFEVLEHLADDAGALAEWLTLVRPGGHLVLSVPADPARFGPWDERVGHYRRYTAGDLAGRLAKAGLEDVRVVHYGWPLGYLLDAVRNRIAGRDPAGDARTPEERTTSSGRTYQPGGAAAGALIRAGIAPFALLQRFRPGAGDGLVAVARRPSGAGPA